MPVDGRVLGELVGDEDANAVAFHGFDGGSGTLAVVAPKVRLHARCQFPHDRFGDQVVVLPSGGSTRWSFLVGRSAAAKAAHATSLAAWRARWLDSRMLSRGSGCPLRRASTQVSVAATAAKLLWKTTLNTR